jgi:hypothetical protein
VVAVVVVAAVDARLDVLCLRGRVCAVAMDADFGGSAMQVWTCVAVGLAHLAIEETGGISRKISTAIPVSAQNFPDVLEGTY